MRRAALAVVVSVVLSVVIAGVARADGGLNPGKTLVERWAGGKWSKVASPSPSGGDELFDVDAVGARSAWAVGVHGRNATSHPLIERWNGSKWLVQKGPRTHVGSSLRGVVALAANDVWTVGTDGQGNGLVEQWNGSHWAIDHDQAFAGADLSAVAASGPNDVWAVGERSSKSFVAHRTTGGWATVATPDAPGEDGFNAVTAISPGDVWAVGASGLFGPQTRTLTEHWNGTAFKVVRSPGGNGSQLAGVADRGSKNVYAAGTLLNAQGCLRTLILHWNGQRWARQTTPNPFSCDNELLGIAASAHGAVAVGDHPQNCPGAACKLVTMTLRLVNGSWHLQSSPSGPAGFSELLGASGVPGTGQFWAVGLSTNSAG